MAGTYNQYWRYIRVSPDCCSAWVEQEYMERHEIFGILYVKTQMNKFLQTFWINQEGQDMAEYAVTLTFILVLVLGAIRLVGSNANNVFSSVASSVH